MKTEGRWLPIIEYANLRKISISSVRRHIKGNRVNHKKNNGKYFIYVDGTRIEKFEAEHVNLETDNERLKKVILDMQEEINDLKMLVNLYEHKPQSTANKPPELPGLEL